MTRQYLIVKTLPKNPTIQDNYDLYLADTESEKPLGTNKDDYDNSWGSYVKLGNAAREIADQIQEGNLKSVIINIHSETEPITDSQRKKLEELAKLAIKGEFQWCGSYEKIHFGSTKTKYS